MAAITVNSVRFSYQRAPLGSLRGSSQKGWTEGSVEVSDRTSRWEEQSASIINPASWFWIVVTPHGQLHCAAAGRKWLTQAQGSLNTTPHPGSLLLPCIPYPVQLARAQCKFLLSHCEWLLVLTAKLYYPPQLGLGAFPPLLLTERAM